MASPVTGEVPAEECPRRSDQDSISSGYDRIPCCVLDSVEDLTQRRLLKQCTAEPDSMVLDWLFLYRQPAVGGVLVDVFGTMVDLRPFNLNRTLSQTFSQNLPPAKYILVEDIKPFPQQVWFPLEIRSFQQLPPAAWIKAPPNRTCHQSGNMLFAAV